MVSFSLRQRISYRFLKDPSPVSFHLIQFAGASTYVNVDPVEQRPGNPIAIVCTVGFRGPLGPPSPAAC